MVAITNLQQFKIYLEEVAKRADTIKDNGWPDETNVESMCAHMWRDFTPHALTFWLVSGVLNHIADCTAPPIEDTEEDEDE